MTSATLTTPLPPAPARRSSLGRRYGRMWARVPRELGYLALTALIGLVVSVVAWGVVGAGSAFVVLGVALLIALMLGSRYLGIWDLRRLRWAGTRPIAEPVWDRPFAGKGFLPTAHSSMWADSGVACRPRDVSMTVP